MNGQRQSRHGLGLMNWDDAGAPAATVVVTRTQEEIAPDVSRVVYVLAGLVEWLEAAGYGIEGTLTLSGPLHVTIDL